MRGRSAVLGCTGQVGGALMGLLRERGADAVGTGFTRTAPVTLNLGEADAVRSVLDAVRPATILVVGAYTHVDGCEQDPDRSRRVNADGPGAAVSWAAAHGARVVVYSTDYVFDGTSGPYAEDDPIHPLSRYGADKRAAEEAVLSLGDRGLVIRTAWVYSWEDPPRNFMQRLALNLAQGAAARIPDDQIGNPTYAPDLACATLDLLSAGASGIVHAAGADVMSRYAFATRIAEAFGLDPSLIAGIPTAALGQTARRPLNAGLKVERLRRLLGDVPRGPDPVLALLARRHPLRPTTH